MAEISVQGLSALQKALEELPEKLERNVIRSALRVGIKGMKAEAEARVPVKSGDLKASLKIRTRLVKGEPVAGLTAGDKKAYYAHMIEFGTKAHEIKSTNGKPLFVSNGRPIYKVKHPGARAQPFMRPAFDAGNRKAVEDFAAYVRKRLTKAGIEIPDTGDE